MSLIRYIKFLSKNSPMENLRIIHRLDDAKWGKFVGKDEIGNKYYENPEERYVRYRWYMPAFGVLKADSSQVPPGWSQWLHSVSDDTPETMKNTTPHYVWMPETNVPNLTGTKGAFKTYSTRKPVVSSWSPAVASR
ncbi:hypothetical protein BB560_003342 [Smittium megazygosporum]|uniref:NADH dehydrogenase [ubiquinone] 1 alpha subcomplex subunit n=1 Tax=Smittium megazygosporum TaxID=133381 RepID=A0A2T9ZCB7_9FUNG|nr:hypothetical protein BB560_003342 [Smittium megazygosporum]